MGNIEKIIQAIDIQLIQKNKPYMLLAEANRLLTSTRLIADNKALKKIVESRLIPHAYQTQKSPKQSKSKGKPIYNPNTNIRPTNSLLPVL